jgi:uncharacterized membrane protein YcaP (DUF421 family)
VDPARIAIRALTAFAYLAIMTRVSGKRIVGQATPFDFVISLIVGDLIDDAIWAEIPMSMFAAAAGSIFIADSITKIAAFRSRRFFQLVNGAPDVVLRDGVEDRGALRRGQLNEGDLAHLLRLKGIAKFEQLRLAIFERDHSLSIFWKKECEPATRRDR